MFCGCFFPFGIQLLISIPAAFMMRGSKVGATLGTFLTNHFTIFIIYPLQCYVGNHLIGGSLSWTEICKAMDEVLEKQNFESLFALSTDLIWSFFIAHSTSANTLGWNNDILDINVYSAKVSETNSQILVEFNVKNGYAKALQIFLTWWPLRWLHLASHVCLLG